MKRAVLFLILTFGMYAAAQARGGSAGAVSSSGGSATGATAGANTSPGMGSTQPAAGPAATAPTTNLGSSLNLPNGTGEVQGVPGTVGISNNAGTNPFANNGGFITNGGFGNGGFVPLLQTPSATFPSALGNLPNNPAGITNNPSALYYGNLPSNEGVFNTGAASTTVASGTADTRSLGEIAAEYRTRRGQQQAARVFTNADIDHLNQSNGQTQVGTNLGPGNAVQQPASGPQSPTTPRMGNPGQQPGQNQNLPGGDVPQK